MTQPYTDLPDWFRFRFRVSLPRWRWQAQDVDGERCLVPSGRPLPEPFTGDVGLLGQLIDLADADDVAIERFANRYTGLYARSARTPPEESLDGIRSEATVLGLLRVTGRAGLERRRLSRTGVNPALARRIDDALTMAALALDAARPDVRPLEVDADETPEPAERSDASLADRPNAEWQLMEWASSTIRDTWSLSLPLDDWRMAEPDERRLGFGWVMPEVRCLTLLGYAYAQLIAQLQARAQQSDGPAGRSLLCQRCGALLPDHRDSGRRRRSDSKWCDGCRRMRNAESQARRRRDLRRSRTAPVGPES